jgi:two-component system sensor histidine kinase KdpD
MPAYSPTEEGMLIVARRQGPSLDPDEAAFLRTLSMQAQLAIHNALLYRRQEQQFERLKIFNATQDAFFTAAAHDLKTPLTVLGVLTSTLRMTIPQPSTQQEEMLQTLEQNIRRLQRHTENMLAAARLEADDVVLRLRAIDPRRVALRSVEALASPLRDKDVRVVLQPESPWPRVTADPDRLGEMFGNLLSNAVKFAPRGSRVTIDLSFHEQDDVFSVCNAGSTVAESERERIFEKAYTGKHAGARAGSGLGLYIVRKLVALHGGRTWVDVSADSVCFRFSLPHRREEEDAGDDWSADEDTSDR